MLKTKISEESTSDGEVRYEIETFSFQKVYSSFDGDFVDN